MRSVPFSCRHDDNIINTGDAGRGKSKGMSYEAPSFFIALDGGLIVSDKPGYSWHGVPPVRLMVERLRENLADNNLFCNNQPVSSV